MNQFRNWLIRFMQGRYGQDQLSRFLLGLAFFFMILELFLRSRICSLLVTVLIILCYWRMFSKNIPARYQENVMYLQATERVRVRIASMKRQFAQRKTHKIFRCPMCKQKIRVPKGRGRIEITCPKCREKFIRNS